MSRYKRIFSLFLLIIISNIFIVSPLNVSANDLVATTDANTVGIGDYSVIVPSTENQLYDVRLSIIRKYDDGKPVYGGDEVYYVEVKNADGTTVNTNLSNYYKFASGHNQEHNHPELAVTIPNVPAGSSVLVKHILVEKIEYDAWDDPLWSNYRLTYMGTNITNTDPNSKEIVLIESDDVHIQLAVGGLISQTSKVEEPVDNSFVRTTTDTLLGLSGYPDYTSMDFLTYLLSSYNVVSLDEIHSTHIVGPIISQNVAERTTENGAVSGFLAASDYSGGIPSYIGNFTSFVNAGKNEVGVKFNYKFDRDQNGDFVPPFLYSKANEEDLKINVKGDVNHFVDHYLLDNGQTDVLSTNDWGLQLTYQNNKFIDFTALSNALNQTSLNIMDNGNAENYEEHIKYEFDTDGTIEGSTITIKIGEEEPIVIRNGETYTPNNGDDPRNFSSFVSQSLKANDTNGGIRLTINMEESWTIKNADNLQEVNMILPDDYDYYDNPYMLPTTINFDCEYINPAVYQIDTNGDGVKEDIKHSRMPYTLVDGGEFEESLGENGEYGEVGNKIIWNMPNVVTGKNGENDNRLTVLERAHNIAGHIVAPQAEFWNYDTNGGWLGGNLNGTAIVKSFYSGIMEIHKWSYKGLAESAVVHGVKALKKLNGGDPTREYTFKLDLDPEAYPNGEIPDGVLNNTFPIYANSSIVATEKDEIGKVKFTSLAFNKVGEYSFIVKEDTSMATDNVDYDLTQYRIVITVAEAEDSTPKDTKFVIAGTKKYRITERDGTPITPVFIEEDPNVTEFVFNNLTTDEGLVNLRFIKKCTTEHVLSGAKFYITEMTSATDETKPEGGYFESVSSDVNGHIDIEGLEKDKYYKIWEYEAPVGHELAKGYWIAYIGPQGFLVSIEAKDGAEEILNNTIYNKHIEQTHLEINIIKKNQMNDYLGGVNFNLKRVVINEQGIPQEVVGGVDNNYTTDANGVIKIENLEANKIYMLTETSTPDHHIEHTGYWLITVTGNPLNPSEVLSYTIVEYDKNHNFVGDVTDDTIYNEKEEFKLPTTGGSGTEKCYIIGIALMLTALVFYKRKALKKYK